MDQDNKAKAANTTAHNHLKQTPRRHRLLSGISG